MKKIAVILYSTIAYVVFLVAFLYAIGFVGDFLVPKTINSGEETPFLSALLINLGLMSLFALQHSVMARPAFKRWLTKFIHPNIERSTYVLLSSSALLLMYWQWQPLTTVLWQVENETLAIIITSIYFLGWAIVFLASFMISHFELLGLRQMFEYVKGRLPSSNSFSVRYMYTMVRHPMMLGFIIAFWATPMMTVGHLIFACVTTSYILVAVKFLEEKDLKKMLGKDYEDYQKKVPMIIPFTKRKQGGISPKQQPHSPVTGQ
jgi:protein-S-isoprenylcysteine O-methyltransferase Ste14